MVFKLSKNEVLKVCSNCDSYLKGFDSCRNPETSQFIGLQQVRTCNRWDEYYGGRCIYQGN